MALQAGRGLHETAGDRSVAVGCCWLYVPIEARDPCLHSSRCPHSSLQPKVQDAHASHGPQQLSRGPGPAPAPNSKPPSRRATAAQASVSNSNATAAAAQASVLSSTAASSMKDLRASRLLAPLYGL